MNIGNKLILCFRAVSSVFTFVIFLFIAGSGDALAKDNGKAEQAVATDQQQTAGNYFAIINGEKIDLSVFLYTFSKAVKEKFYHGKVSRDKLETFKKEVAENLVLEILLANEARKQGLQLDAGAVQRELDKYDVKLSKQASDKQKEDLANYKKKALPIIKASIERQQLIQLLKQKIKNIKKPPVKAVKAYYEANIDKFTAPQSWDVSIILLPVDPSASSDEWDQTVEKAEQLIKKIRKGESFEELARIHSGDPSAADGGHMGYMHIGMFGEPAQKVLNVMEVGEISEPVVLLEGVAIFRLNGIEKASLNTFKEVEVKARKLLTRDLADKAWDDFKVSIRKTAKVQYGDLLTLQTPKTEPQSGAESRK